MGLGNFLEVEEGREKRSLIAFWCGCGIEIWELAMVMEKMKFHVSEHSDGCGRVQSGSRNFELNLVLEECDDVVMSSFYLFLSFITRINFCKVVI